MPRAALASILGVLIGGWGVLQFGVLRALVIGGVLVIVTNLGFMTLALQESPGLLGLGLVVGADHLAYTATQYALFSSLFSPPGKLPMGASGTVVDSFGYPIFFAYTSMLGLPALALILWLRRRAPGPNEISPLSALSA